MIDNVFINELNEKYGFQIESITAMLKDEDGNVVKSDNIYKRDNTNDSFVAGKKFVAINLLKNNVDIGFISKVTHLSLSYIKKLKQSIK